MIPLSKRKHFQVATKFLDEHGVEQFWKDSSSDDWLTHNMVEPAKHAYGPRQVAKYLSHFEESRSPGAPQAFEKKAPPLFMKEKPKDPFRELSEEIKETSRKADEMNNDKSEDEFIKERAQTLKDRIRNIDPNNPERMRLVMEFIRDEYEDDDPKYAIANVFVDLPVPTGKGEEIKNMRKQLMTNLMSLINSPAFQKSRKDETFVLSPAQRFDLYLAEFIQDVKRVLMDDDLWDDLAAKIGIVAHAIRAMIRTAMFFARTMKRG